MASGLTDDEKANVKAALAFLQVRFGKLALLAKALRLQPDSVRKVMSGHDGVSAEMVLRVARLAGVGLDDVLAGRWPVKGMCPHCGQGP
jgi:hypothetical protein